ncbi:MAG: hypothetical protein SCALA702_14410 [Melioribacteraceae bacterium]|nr:MAG: hypothetical protein SCALA702_14410 [Melioribacteraceae bacterium]
MILRKQILSFLTFVILTASLTAQSEYQFVKERIEAIADALEEKIEIIDGRLPEFTINGEWKYREKVNWFSGFTAGEAWLMNELTGREALKEEALNIADFLLEYSEIDYTHDMGFIFFPSVVEAYKNTGDAKYKNAALKAAKMLAKRFNENGNFIRAWGKLGSENRAGVVIIDTMMNLELLFWAAQEFGLPELYDIAYKHAITCLNEHVRANFSSYHVVEFDPASGELLKKYTHQGFKDESTWARGQAWGIYGFAQAYQYTEDERFLNTSRKMADYFIKHLPEDFVPFWDLDLSGEDVLRDASAGAIAASGMYMLSELITDKTGFEKYRTTADNISLSLIKDYSFLSSKREKEEGLLLHTIYNYHKDWGVDESFPCGDYYFVEAFYKYFNKNFSLEKSQGSIRSKINLNENWFYLEDNVQFDGIAKTAAKWERIDLPHSWNKFDAVDQEPGYRRDASWYEKSLYIPELKPDKKYILEFEGANLKTFLYVNSEYVGEHIGGYVGFDFDITKFLKKGENNILVRVDNSVDRSVIPSQKSDFFIYGGINRDVWLNVVPLTNLDNLHITTTDVSKSTAKVTASFTIDKGYENSEAIVKVISPDGEVIEEITTSAASQNEISLPELNDPVLWSTEAPNLYTLVVSLESGGEVIDEIRDRFGLRWFEFKEHGAFYLNGERLKLRGTHRHEDHAGMANAIPNELHRKDMKDIKEMGANFVRLAHYPQDPEVYKACDELGILVWDELPWCRGGVGDEEWQETAKRLFTEQITQNYNHPSIVLWSVGNEVYWLPDYEGGGDTQKLVAFTKELHELAHKLDPNRLTSIRKFYDADDIVYVFSPSIWAGWYSGVYKSYEKAVKDGIKKYNRFFHAEYGGSSHLGRHTESPITGDGILNPDEWSEAVNQVKVKSVAKIGDWSENYMVDLFDWHLVISESVDEFTGNAQWAYKDFGTPLRPENSMPYMNQKGLVDRAGNPKDAYYVFKAAWNKTDPFVYIESHTWTNRYGKPDEKREVAIYSNCEEVELFLNGKTLGKKEKDITKFPASGLNWNVDFIDGVNELIALGTFNGSVVKDSVKLSYTTTQPGKASEIILSKERMSCGKYLVTATVVDKDGNVCPDFNDRVYFMLSGSGKLYENYGTYTKSSVIEFSSGKASIEFRAVPFEKAIIEARTQDFKGSYLVIE